MPNDTVFYHLTRLAHIGCTCVGCGQCTLACPSRIPVADLFISVTRIARKAFDYIPGRNDAEPLPLSVFRNRNSPTWWGWGTRRPHDGSHRQNPGDRCRNFRDPGIPGSGPGRLSGPVAGTVGPGGRALVPAGYPVSYLHLRHVPDAAHDGAGSGRSAVPAPGACPRKSRDLYCHGPGLPEGNPEILRCRSSVRRMGGETTAPCWWWMTRKSSGIP